MVMKLANIFGWDIDFILDIRKGDRFMLVYEKLYREGEFLRDGEILAATFINQGERSRPSTSKKVMWPATSLRTAVTCARRFCVLR